MSADDPAETSFANHIYPDWDVAMDQFFRAVDKKRVARGLSEEQVHQALYFGYGDDIADNWREWVDADA